MKKTDALISVSISTSISITFLSLKNTQKTSLPFIAMKMKMVMKNRLDNDKSGINRARSRHRPKYSKYNVSR